MSAHEQYADELAALVDRYLGDCFVDVPYRWACRLQFALDQYRGLMNPDFGEEARDFVFRERGEAS